MQCSKINSKREVYSNIILHQKKKKNKKTSNRQPHFTPKTTGKRRPKNFPKLEKAK